MKTKQLYTLDLPNYRETHVNYTKEAAVDNFMKLAKRLGYTREEVTKATVARPYTEYLLEHIKQIGESF